MTVGYRLKPQLIFLIVIYSMSHLMKATSACSVRFEKSSSLEFPFWDSRVDRLSADVGSAGLDSQTLYLGSVVSASDDSNVITLEVVENRFFGVKLVSDFLLAENFPSDDFSTHIAEYNISAYTDDLVNFYNPILFGDQYVPAFDFVFVPRVDFDTMSWRYFLFVKSKRFTLADYFISYGTIVNAIFSIFIIGLLISDFCMSFDPLRDSRYDKINFDLSYLEDMRWWRKKLREYYPGREFTLAREKLGEVFSVSLKIKIATGHVKYAARSRHCYADALLTLAARLPKVDAPEIRIHGILDFFGLKETVPIKFLKHLAFFCYNYSLARNKPQKFIAILQWLDSVHEMSQRLGANPSARKIIESFMVSRELRDTLVGNISYDLDDGVDSAAPAAGPFSNVSDFPRALDGAHVLNPDVQVDIQGISDAAASINSFLKGVVNSSSVRALLRLIALVWHVLFVFKDGKIDWDHLTKWDTAMFASVPERALNLGQTVLEQLQNLATCSYEFYQSRDYKVFLRNDNEVTKFLEEVEVLVNKVKLYPLKDTITPDMANFEIEIREAIEKGENLRPKVKLSVRPAFTTGLIQLRSLAIDVSTMARSCSSRPAPFSVLVTGPPKIGKANVTALIAAQFRASNPLNKLLGNNLTLPSQGIYTRTLKEEYWSCYMNSHWCVIYDDLGQTNPKCAEFSLEINEIIQVVNNASFFPNMAGVDEKGKRYVAPQLVIATSNNKDLNAAHAVRSPAAVLRRFPFVVTPRLRDCFKTDNVLDPKKVLNYADLWTFTVEEVMLSSASANSGVTYKVIHNDISTGEFLAWLDKAANDHYKGQIGGNKFLSCINNDRQCDVCKCLSLFCKCTRQKESFAPPFEVYGRQIDGVTDYYASHFVDSQVDSPGHGDKIVSIDGVHVRGLNYTELVSLLHGDNNSVVSLVYEESAGFEIERTVEHHRTRSVPGRMSEPMIPDDIKINAVSHYRTLPQKRVNIRGWFSVFQSFIVIWLMTQGLLAGFCLHRIAKNPLSWFFALFIHKYNIPYRHNVMEMDAFCLFARNMVGFDWLENFTFYWMLGWDATASACRRHLVAAQRKISQNPKMIAAIASAIACSAFLVWYYSMMSRLDDCVEVQAGDEKRIPAGVAPPPADANIDNTWKAAGSLSFSSFLTRTSRTGSPDYLRSALESAFACFTLDSTEVNIRGLNIFGQYWLLPRHYVTKHWHRSKEVLVTRARSFGAPNFGSHKCVIDMQDVILCPDSDFALVKLGMPPGPNLLPYLTKFPKGSCFEAEQAMIREGQGLLLHPTGPVKLFEMAIPRLSELNNFPLDRHYSVFIFNSELESRNGDCGSPLVVLEKGRTFIAGFHVGTRGADALAKMALPLPLDWLTSVYSELPNCVVQGDIAMNRPDGSEFSVADDVHEKCPLRFEGISDAPTGSSVIPLGEIKGIAQNRFASKVALNRFAGFWTGLGYVTNKIRPTFNSETCKSWLPKRNFLLIASQHKDTMDPGMIRECSKHYFQRLTRLIPIASIRKLRVIDAETNLYGAESNSFISHINFGSGAGFPYNKPKFEVMVPTTREGFPQGTFKLSEFTQERVDAAEIKLSEGVRPNFVFNASLKDEPISLQKMQMGKIRVFMAICLEGLFLLRKYFLSLIALFQTWNFATEAAIGMDATGPDWDDIHDYLYPSADWKVFCGDYSNYDQRMSGVLLLAAWNILIELAKLSGQYPLVALRIMFGLAIECVYVTVNFFGDLIILNGTNPSGHALTVVINSICNSIYMRYAWLSIFGTLDGFDECVRLMTYGDDNCVSVHRKYWERFNQVTVTAALAKVGVVYTDAKKTGNAAPPFCEEADVSFLKRGFRRAEEGFWAAPLERASIEKMLIIGVQSGKVQEGDRLASVLISSVMEAFQHEPDFFHLQRNRAVECAQLYGLTGWVEAKGGFPTYEQLLDRRALKVSRKGLLSQVLNQRAPNDLVTSEMQDGDVVAIHGGDHSESRGATPQNHFHGGASAVHDISCKLPDKCTAAQEYSLAKTTSKQTLFRFLEKDSGESVGYKAGGDPTIAKTDRGSYADFFSRPVQIAQYEWSENTAFPDTFISPWHAYFANQMIWSKLQGFSRLRANLKLKFVVNGSPFRYGEAMVSYRPLFNYSAGSDSSSTWTNSGQPFFSGGDIAGDHAHETLNPAAFSPGAVAHGDATLMARSQRMNIKLSPQTNKGGEMTLPFIYYKDALPLLDPRPIAGSLTALALKELGTLVIENVVNLTSTAAANASPVTVTLFAWAEDVEVWGPTSSTLDVVQGDDENADATKPSYVASAVADSARALSGVPIIGPYAMATSFAADAVSKILKFFGWSNPPIITGVMGIVPKTSFLNPNPRMSFADEVVALDGKNEVTVDPRTVGVPPADELCVDSFCKRSCIFDRFTWQVTDGPATALATLPVTPTYYRASWVNNPVGDFDCARVTMSPACYASQLFNLWRGTFCLRIRVVCSQFHRGRLLVSWDPNPSYATADGQAGRQISDVLDLASANELVFKVPFMSHLGMLSVFNLPVSCSTSALAGFKVWGNRSTTTDWTTQTLYTSANGVVFISVLNELQCGDATADAVIVAETWMEDMHLAVPCSDVSSGTDDHPTGTIAALSYNNIVIQGTEVPDGEEATDEVQVSSADEHISKLYSGEAVPSLRVLLHRTYLHRNRAIYSAPNQYFGHLMRFCFPRFPLPLHSFGLNYPDSFTIDDNRVMPTNYSNTTPIAYITSCFVGFRGGMVWKSATTEAYSGKGAYFSALLKGGNVASNGSVALKSGTTQNDNLRQRQFSNVLGAIQAGSSSSLQSSNGVCSGLFPMYANWRMFPGNVNRMYEPATHSAYDNVSLGRDVVTWAGVNSTSGYFCDLLLSVSAATDFNVFGFVNVPDVYVQNSI